MYELPFGRGRRFAGNVGKLADLAVGGWQLNTIASWQSGVHRSVTSTNLTGLAYVTGHRVFSDYLDILYLPQAGEITIFCGAMVGASMGFLWWNCYPAQVFMGDVGSLALGGALGTVALLIKQELLLFSVGGLFVLEALSVILQVGYSYGLKQQVILDVFIIAAGFVMRAVAGAVAITVAISPWLYVLIGLGALFLGFGKQRAEIMLLNETAGQHRRVLEEYSATLLEELIAIITSATVMAYALYTMATETHVRLGTARLPLTIPFVLYGIFRYLYLLYRRDLGGNPSEHLLTDRALLVDVALWGAAVIVVLYVAR